MSIFKRGISNEHFISMLQAEKSNPNSYWNSLINDRDLFVAIRNEYLNVYYRGQSVCKLMCIKSNFSKQHFITGYIHNKYIGIDKASYAYIVNGIILDKQSKIKSLSEIDQIKRNIKKHILREKDSSYSDVLNATNSVIDVEITFSKDLVEVPKRSKDYERSSIDYLIVDESGTLQFYEAKHYSNNEIRSKTIPSVISQIKRYQREINSHADEIIGSYELVIKNRFDLGIPSNITIENILNKSIKITVNPLPKLIIFGTQSKSWTGKEIIQKELGESLIIK